ncbi:putative bifunctional diguanylate cyclase/phosphodiesterase [Roseovarius sp.]|uniref:putative bifunctional diguanylate cyclase/phosphodiesterase n=1 Tax=Roseovarius sp. TaxID=1486281 RepID=UPI003A97B8B6
MFYKTKQIVNVALTSVAQAMRWPQSLALLTAAALAAHWFGTAALFLALPVTVVLFSLSSRPDDLRAPPHTDLTDDSTQMYAQIERTVSHAHRNGLRTGCLILQIDDYASLTDRYGLATADRVMVQTLERLARALRAPDQLFDLGVGRIGVLLTPGRDLGHDRLLFLADRLSAALKEPITLDATTLYISASIGLCLDGHAPARSAKALFDATMTALDEARRHGPSAIRAYARGMRAATPLPHQIADELQQALDTGQFISWFQPQISAATGEITGFEALARWMHPTAGLITPAEFLPLLAASGRMEVLGDAMLANALRALQTWDNLDLDIQYVSVNFSPEELRNPHLPAKIAWELDRCDLAPSRLTVEILETVLATSADDTITRNIAALADMGCLIDLDDFGTGHASISTIRRFAVQRLKIDRSFVTKIDHDPEQQRMVAAILSMAERLDLATLAEGVETAGEHAMLAQLGCGHLQGFGIGRPMPLDATADWIATHRAKFPHPPRITRAKG